MEPEAADTQALELRRQQVRRHIGVTALSSLQGCNRLSGKSMKSGKSGNAGGNTQNLYTVRQISHRKRLQSSPRNR